MTDEISELRAKLLHAETRLSHRARLMERMRRKLVEANNELSDEGGRVYFGSTNHADDFREFVNALDDLRWGDILDDGKAPDYITELREAREEIAQLKTPTPAEISVNGETIRAPEWPTGNDPEYSRGDLHLIDAALCGSQDRAAKRPALVDVHHTATELREALHRSVGMQSHYARLLNQLDGGKRLTFASVEEWIERLRALDRAAHAEKHRGRG